MVRKVCRNSEALAVEQLHHPPLNGMVEISFMRLIVKVDGMVLLRTTLRVPEQYRSPTRIP